MATVAALIIWENMGRNIPQWRLTFNLNNNESRPIWYLRNSHQGNGWHLFPTRFCLSVLKHFAFPVRHLSPSLYLLPVTECQQIQSPAILFFLPNNGESCFSVVQARNGKHVGPKQWPGLLLFTTKSFVELARFV